MIFYILSILLLLVAIGFSISFADKVWSPVLALFATAILLIVIGVSIYRVDSSSKIEPEWFNVLEGKNAIYVESNIEDFKLTNFSDKRILEANRIYIIIPKNVWGVKLDSKKEIVYK